ncbi:hypothetical protein CGMCC3_g15817 [Colletotrichum fructicola]|nr:uncharacterized protein CGMCC3_g15817 [Colletotrichum fructicola]KAE9568018.1 hypothetical protein CGMCC3_g15817 [Colletotrichum fructicola]
MASAWVIDTVDYGLRQSSCRAMWDLRTWYANLRTSVGATEREQQTAARRKYQTATKILSSVPKDFAGWITSWEMATNHALPIFGGWVTIYAGIYKDKLEEKTLTIGEVAKDLRKEAERRDLLGLQEKGSRLTRGVFGPTFATGQSQSMLPQLEATPSNEEGDTQTRNQATVAIEIGFRFSVLQSARRAGVPGPLGASYGRSAPAYSRAGLGQPITSYPTQSVGD